MRKNFFASLEETATLFTLTDENSRQPIKTLLTEVSGLASVSDPGTVNASGSTVVNSTVSFAMKPSEAAKLSTLKIGDHLVLDGITYVVMKIDLRGVLPTAYSSKIVGMKR